MNCFAVKALAASAKSTVAPTAAPHLNFKLHGNSLQSHSPWDFKDQLGLNGLIAQNASMGTTLPENTLVFLHSFIRLEDKNNIVHLFIYLLY